MINKKGKGNRERRCGKDKDLGALKEIRDRKMCAVTDLGRLLEDKSRKPFLSLSVTQRTVRGRKGKMTRGEKGSGSTQCANSVYSSISPSARLNLFLLVISVAKQHEDV